MPIAHTKLLLGLLLGLLATPALADYAPVRIFNATPLEGVLLTKFGHEKMKLPRPQRGQRLTTPPALEDMDGIPRGESGGRSMTSASFKKLLLAHEDPLCQPALYPINLAPDKETLIVVTAEPVRDATGKIKAYTLKVQGVQAPRKVEGRYGKIYGLSASKKARASKLIINNQVFSLSPGKPMSITPKRSPRILAKLGGAPAQIPDVDPDAEPDGTPEDDGGMDTQQCPYPKRRHAFLVVYDRPDKTPGFSLMP